MPPPPFIIELITGHKSGKKPAVIGGCWDNLFVSEMPLGSEPHPIISHHCFLSFVLSFLIFPLPATHRKTLHACRHTDSTDQRECAAHPWRSLTRFQGNTQQDNGLYLAIPAHPHKRSTSKPGRVSSKLVETGREEYKPPKILNRS